jgi:hypothetical protein
MACTVTRPHGPGFLPMGIPETDDVLPFQNLFSEKVSVNCIVCRWVTASVFMYRVSHGLYGTGPDSPGLSPCRYLKKCWHKNCSHTIQELKHNIWDENATINQEPLHRVSDDFVNHLRQGVANEGGQLQDVSQSNNLIALYRKLEHFISSLSYCVKYFHVTKCVCLLCATLYNTIIQEKHGANRYIPWK